LLIHIDKVDATIDEQLSEFPTCSVCLSDLDKKAIRLKCGHLFHEACAKEWLKQSEICPNCRHKYYQNTVKQDSGKAR